MTEDGFSGTAKLDLSNLKIEGAGYGTSTKNVSTTRTYPNLDSADMQYIPKTTVENGKTLELSGIHWQSGNTQNINDTAITATPSATEKPSATTVPTTKPSTDTPSIYEKVTDAIYAPAVVKEVETTTKDGEDMYAVTLLAQGKEIKTLIENDVTFETSSEAYSFMKGKDAGNLEEGDVISLTSNVAGTRINHMYFIYRPQDEDIITGSQDFGTDFEKLITENGSSVANQWKLMKYTG